MWVSGRSQRNNLKLTSPRVSYQRTPLTLGIGERGASGGDFSLLRLKSAADNSLRYSAPSPPKPLRLPCGLFIRSVEPFL